MPIVLQSDRYNRYLCLVDTPPKRLMTRSERLNNTARHPHPSSHIMPAHEYPITEKITGFSPDQTWENVTLIAPNWVGFCHTVTRLHQLNKSMGILRLFCHLRAWTSHTVRLAQWSYIFRCLHLLAQLSLLSFPLFSCWAFRLTRLHRTVYIKDPSVAVDGQSL